jgi:hypothetical protein
MKVQYYLRMMEEDPVKKKINISTFDKFRICSSMQRARGAYVLRICE